MSGIWIVTAGICTALVFGRFLPSVLSRFLPIERAAAAAPLASLSDFHGRQEMQPAPPSRAGELAKMLVPVFAVICVMIAVMTHPRPVRNSPNIAGSSAGSVESGSGVGDGAATGSDHHADSEVALADQVRILQSKIASLQTEQSRQAELVKSLKQKDQLTLSAAALRADRNAKALAEVLALDHRTDADRARAEADADAARTRAAEAARVASQSVQEANAAREKIRAQLNAILSDPGTPSYVILPGNQEVRLRHDPWNYPLSSIDSVALYDPCSPAVVRSPLASQDVPCPSRLPQGVQ